MVSHEPYFNLDKKFVILELKTYFMKVLLPLFLVVHTLTLGQTTINNVEPVNIIALDLSNEEAAKFHETRQIYAAISEKVSAGTKVEDLSEDERKIWNETDETIENYWDIIGGGCSWYCGGGPKEVIASSQLKAQGANSYDAGNAHDLSYKTAWVEGAAGYGIGEFLVYKFSPTSPRITDVIVVNGYVKSEKAYLENSRVKTLKMYLNDKPFAILQLEDQRSEQVFKFQPIGNSNRENFEALKLKPDWTLKFEILEVYRGAKFEDVAITEIYFDGIDVH
jgi:hypothetical protein